MMYRYTNTNARRIKHSGQALLVEVKPRNRVHKLGTLMMR